MIGAIIALHIDPSDYIKSGKFKIQGKEAISSGSQPLFLAKQTLGDGIDFTHDKTQSKSTPQWGLY